MTLDELITTLEAADPNRVVRNGFTNPHSYRGYYDELAFEPATNVTIADMLTAARSALGATYEGWKGGDFTMSGYTDCWLSMEGSASGETIGPVLLRMMLADDAQPATRPEPDEPTASLSQTERDMLRYVLDLAEDQMLSRGDEFSEADFAAVDSLRHMATEGPQS